MRVAEFVIWAIENEKVSDNSLMFFYDSVIELGKTEHFDMNCDGTSKKFTGHDDAGPRLLTLIQTTLLKKNIDPKQMNEFRIPPIKTI